MHCFKEYMDELDEQYIFLYFMKLQPDNLPIGKCLHDEFVCVDKACLSFWMKCKNIYIHSKNTEHMQAIFELATYDNVIYSWLGIYMDGFKKRELTLSGTRKTLYMYSKTAPNKSILARGFRSTSTRFGSTVIHKVKDVEIKCPEELLQLLSALDSK